MIGIDAKLTSVVEFQVGGDVPHRALTAATDAGLAAARTLVGGAVDGTGSLGSVRGETRSRSEGPDAPSGASRTRGVRIALTMRAPPAIALAAEAAFARAFVAKLEGQGYAARRE
ncbi:MAG TPA: hypothetical protein VM370_00335 [Candidatus Thermoplasmatota archaeon]|nr:hypothetical protein [Candidatus Thermoplasmatota archaeon]